MSASLVGSEMCIRDRPSPSATAGVALWEAPDSPLGRPPSAGPGEPAERPVSYTHLTLPTICSV
eukprot:160089-Alexandrium_andersonii.AAC.1